MYAGLAELVRRHWLTVLLVWLCAVVAVRLIAPPWSAIIQDGDFAYLPSYLPSVIGEQWMAEAFPLQRGRSQVVAAVVRPDEPMTNDDVQIGYDLARRLKNLCAATQLAAAQSCAARQREAHQAGRAAEAAEQAAQRQAAVQQAADLLQDALQLEDKLNDYWEQPAGAGPAGQASRPPTLDDLYHNLALLAQWCAADPTLVANPPSALAVTEKAVAADAAPRPETAAGLPLVDVWTWRDSYFGSKLVSRDNSVRLVVVQLSNEFMAVDNIRVVQQLEEAMEPVRAWLHQHGPAGLMLLQSGSAAVGADLLRSAAASIRHTEIVTVLLVVAILVVVYRSPLLLIVPLATILVSLLVSSGLVALLTQLATVPGFGWWTLMVFSTTRIFIVVILFGAGTDFCLFLIARYKEELAAGLPHGAAVSAALAHVGTALTASALTTILGLSMMVFAEFGKYRYSGPVIGLCLFITLITCITLTPALLHGLGPLLGWTWRDATQRPARPARGPLAGDRHTARWATRLWQSVARRVVAQPALVLTLSVLALLPLAAYGARTGQQVTYDFLSGLPRDCPSRQGTDVLRRHFPVGESGPTTVLVHREGAQFESPEGRAQIRNLSDALHGPGILTVRSAEDPLGDYAPGEKPGILSDRGRTLRILRAHPRTKAIFVAQTPSLAGNVARFELILHHDPFSLAAIQTVDGVEQTLRGLTESPDAFWYRAQFALTGTTAAIRDLRSVTHRDNLRIQVLVVVAVLGVLLAVLRRPATCAYMMLSVLLSYYVTIGLTAFVFSMAYGDAYPGLDWKVPLFLFVIMVAVGQDYNVYLATRVFEEQARLGPFAGLRRALVQTGGIITSCGIIMAGTFISMTAAVWPDLLPGQWAHSLRPALGPVRSILELGFALSLGMLLDTLVVRTVLLPAFLALVCRWQARGARTPTK
ncbi:MAG: MMPL family transporter [Pirellulaceae bacterium]|jgi:RND superfamily putative drug exporter|nr:MMPL family transporter [Pirellulaceae bacterium]